MAFQKIQKVENLENVKNSENSENSENSINSEISEETGKPKKTRSQLGKMAKGKGARGEREVAKLFMATMIQIGRDDIAEEIKRNSLQSDRGGFDLVGLPGLAPEVKFCETLLLDKWFDQCQRQAKGGLFPVLIYRQSHKPWKVRTFTSLQNPSVTSVMQWVITDYPLNDFLAWYAQWVRTMPRP